jgi:AraC-like DNA-binding protein
VDQLVFTLHPALEVGLITSGSYERDHGRGWFGLEAGQGWVCGPLEAHRWRFPAGGYGGVVFNFSVAAFEQMPNLAGFDPTALFRSPTRIGAIGVGEVRPELLALGRELVDKYRDPVPPGRAWIDLMRMIDLLSQCQSVTTQETARPAVDTMFGADGIVPAIELLEGSLSRRVPLSEAAAACNMSRGGFARLFVKTTGHTFAAFALRWRLSEVARLLHNTDLSVKEIAFRCGFEYDTHLHAAFRDHFGMSPGEYRKHGGG